MANDANLPGGCDIPDAAGLESEQHQEIGELNQHARGDDAPAV